MKYQIFVPIALIQALNVFWYFLIWRILIRYVLVPILNRLAKFDVNGGVYSAVTSSNLADERSDDEDEEPAPVKGKTNGKTDRKVEPVVEGDSYKDL